MYYQLKIIIKKSVIKTTNNSASQRAKRINFIRIFFSNHSIFALGYVCAWAALLKWIEFDIKWNTRKVQTYSYSCLYQFNKYIHMSWDLLISLNHISHVSIYVAHFKFRELYSLILIVNSGQESSIFFKNRFEYYVQSVISHNDWQIKIFVKIYEKTTVKNWLVWITKFERYHINWNEGSNSNNNNNISSEVP